MLSTISVWVPISSSLGFVLSRGNSMLNFLVGYETVFHSWYTILHSHLYWKVGSISPYSLLLYFSFCLFCVLLIINLIFCLFCVLLDLIILILVNMMQHFIVVLVCIYLMAYMWSIFFMCFLAIYMAFFWWNVGLSSLPVFKMSCLSFCCWVVRVPYIFWSLDLYQINDLWIFPPVL